MTGPAFLIGVAGSLIAGLVRQGGYDPGMTLQALLRWLLITLVVFGAGRVLTRRRRLSEGRELVSYYEVFRGLGFAQTALAFGLLAVIPPLAPFARLLSTVLTIVASWLASAVAHDLHGWRNPFLIDGSGTG
jgi:hypothetical protein